MKLCDVKQSPLNVLKAFYLSVDVLSSIKWHCTFNATLLEKYIGCAFLWTVVLCIVLAQKIHVSFHFPTVGVKRVHEQSYLCFCLSVCSCWQKVQVSLTSMFYHFLLKIKINLTKPSRHSSFDRGPGFKSHQCLLADWLSCQEVSRGDVTRSPKQRYQWPHKKDIWPPKKKRNCR